MKLCTAEIHEENKTEIVCVLDEGHEGPHRWFPITGGHAAYEKALDNESNAE